MVKCIPAEDSLNVLSMKNEKGNTPLHLAAAVGWLTICECIASRHLELISTRNSKGETPLFLTAYHGKLDAFLCLHHLYNQKTVQEPEKNKGQEPDDSLCRREDGNTILN
ncbi:uncharacterized protein Fot_52999 [Forsythia ovata]|uniref:Uncharacterized protein n=1 Tax=Forsythia ovata TaxID=205694 RepID=A0ABD1PJ10_9LAMI